MELRGTKRAAKSIYPANTCYQPLAQVSNNLWKISINEIRRDALTHVIRRAQNLPYVRAMADVSRDTKVAKFHVAIRKLASQDQILRLQTRRADEVRLGSR